MAHIYTFVAQFESKSTRGKFYEVKRNELGQLSCNCPGWTRRTKEDGSRTCSHVERVALADEMQARVFTKPAPKVRTQPVPFVKPVATKPALPTPTAQPKPAQPVTPQMRKARDVEFNV